MQEKLNTLISSFIDEYFAKKEVQEQLKAEFDRVVGANPVLQVEESCQNTASSTKEFTNDSF